MSTDCNNQRIHTMAATHYPLHRAPHCQVCGTQMPAYRTHAAESDDSELICDSVDCQHAWQRRLTMSAESFKRYLSIHKLSLRKARERFEIQQRQHEENDRLYRSLLREHGHTDPNSMPLSIIPLACTEKDPQEALRRKEYEDHLKRSIDAAFADKESDVGEILGTDAGMDRDEDRIPAMQKTLCGLCKGGCCTRGANHAYISESTVARVRRHHPHWDEAQVLNAYMQRLPARSIRGSCINHSDHGCTLPREMRASNCNNFVCSAVANWNREHADNERVEGTVIIQRKLDHFTDVSIDNDNGVARVKVVYKDPHPSD